MAHMMMLAPLLLALPLSAAPVDAAAAPLSVTSSPEIGQTLPPFELPDQDGRLRDFASLTGPEGLLLVFHRSADW